MFTAVLLERNKKWEIGIPATDWRQLKELEHTPGLHRTLGVGSSIT